jgi:hypothetical protein
LREFTTLHFTLYSCYGERGEHKNGQSKLAFSEGQIIAEILLLQGSQLIEIQKASCRRVGFASPVEAKGCPIHSKATGIGYF